MRGSSRVKLVKVVKSKKAGKKYEAIFKNPETGREKHIHFGQATSSDYTKHKDKDRRNRYIFRHMKDTKTGNPARAGFLSLYILWNKPTFLTGKFPTKITGYSPPVKSRTRYQSPKRKSPKRKSQKRKSQRR